VTLNNLALLQADRGAWREAEPLLARARRIEEAALGRDNPKLATTLGNQAAVLAMLGRGDEAELLLARAAALRGTAPAAGR
jgi:uncharacterized protein HemY